MELMVRLIVVLPLISAVLVGFFHREIGDRNSRILATSVMMFCALLAWIVFIPVVEAQKIPFVSWISSGDLEVGWGVRFDRLTQIMFVVVCSVSALVHLYSNGYMAHDENFHEGESYRPRFFAFLSLFTFAMLMLVTSDNLVQMFFGWEGVGLASYLLIGFYFRKQSAGAAAMKAFIVNRVGDFGFALGIFGLFFMTGSVGFDEVFGAAEGLANVNMNFLWMNVNAAEILAFLLFIGAMGKSAQFILHTWLPDAMEGPTPVSALIHAATMVTAGVFLVCRMSPLFEFAPGTLAFVTYLGAFTAFFAATIGLVQNDIKRVIAYSTCSQLGYMFAAAGVGVYEAGMYHLFTHAFFKALLFLCAGSVIHAMHHEQDMRNYGALKNKIPYTWGMMMIGTLAITGAGIPFTSIGLAGFFSKDAIIESTWAVHSNAGNFAFVMLVIAAGMTSFYSWRLILMTFFGEARGDMHAHEHAHESPNTMLIPLFVLSLGAILAGVVWYHAFFYDPQNWFAGAVFHHHDIEHTLHEAHEAPAWVKLSPFVMMLLGLFTALWFYVWDKSMPARMVAVFPFVYRFIYNKWYIDELYDFLFVRPALRIGNFLWKNGDERVIDGTINGVAMGLIPRLTARISKWENGLIYTYALSMVVGLVLILLWISMRFGGL